MIFFKGGLTVHLFSESAEDELAIIMNRSGLIKEKLARADGYDNFRDKV